MKERIFKYIIIWFLTVCIAFFFGVGLTACNLRKLIPEAAKMPNTVQCSVVYEEEPKVEDQIVHIEEVEPIETDIFLGEFKLTAYCDCAYCCGKTDGITATGTKATEGRTIAVDPSVIPYGSVVIINGNEYVAEDTGSAIRNNRIDVFFENHEDALIFGVQYAEVYISG